MKFKEYLTDFLGLFFPELCASCDQRLVKNEHFLCTECLFHLPKTHFENDRDNMVAKIFWGRVSIEHATAHFYFLKGGRIQTLLHKLKYKNQREIGVELGKIIGYDLMFTPFMDVDIIIPVPLHKSRMRERGYNQSEYLAKGISQVFEKVMETEVLTRAKANASQTKKHRYERWENVEDIFAITSHDRLKNKHILLVDDVITTGATIEACVAALGKIPDVRVSVAVVAMA